MPHFVHLAPEGAATRIRRAGIRRSRASAKRPAGVFAMPVLRHFYASHQWLRELKRAGHRRVVGVYFRVPDAEPVWLGHYTAPAVLTTAAGAVRLIERADSPEGYEVLIPRRIEPREILRVRALPQVVGWRYLPGAHGQPPCPCPVCLPKGSMKSKRLRTRLLADEAG